MKVHDILSVYYPFSMLRIELNDIPIKYKKYKNGYYVKLLQPCNIKIFFEPWKIQPLIRIDNHLLNYALAEIDCYDHMFEFNWDKDFYDRYFSNIIKFKLESRNITNIDSLDYDLFIGYNNAHEGIVSKIYEEISIRKSS